MRVVWVTQYLPEAHGTGAALHEFELIRQAARRHEVHVITAGLPPGETTLDLGEREVSAEGVGYRPSGPWILGEANRLTLTLGLALAWPTIVLRQERGWVRALAEALARYRKREPVDLVCVVRSELAPVIAAAGAPTALLLFDVYSRHMQRELELGGDRLQRRLLFEAETFKATRWERHWYRRASTVACVSDVDADAVSELVGRPVTVVPNPISEDFFAEPEVPRSPATVTMVGSLWWRPNLDAAAWLVEEVWPRVLSRRPDARLQVVGRGTLTEGDQGSPADGVWSPAALKRLVSEAGGRLDVDVPDIRPYYWDAAVTVAPVRLGSGLRNKVVHAMACHAPVVATPASLEGIEAVPGEHLLVADDAAGFADAIVATLEDPDAAAERADRARAIAEALRSDGVGERLEAWWREAAAPHGRPAASPAPRRRAETPASASVVVCTRERPELLRTALESIARAVAEAPPTEVLVVEQGNPCAGEICAELGLAATVVHDDGRGSSRARNIGVRRAGGEIVLFTDDDCQVPGSWVRDHLVQFEDPGVAASFGAVEGLSRSGDGDPAANLARHYNGTAPWYVGHGSNMAARRSTLLALGAFDERLGPGTRAPAGEDSDLIFRLLRTGATVVSGAGRPVVHVPWRSEDERDEQLLVYERGAGVWVGKALRTEPRAALPHIADRMRLLNLNGERLAILGGVGAFAAGLVRGLALGPWHGTRGN